MVWQNKLTGSLFAANDFIALARLYEYSDGERWALNNRISAFAELGLPLEPDLANWMARWALNFFPLERTGFKHVTSLAPGTLLEVSRAGIRRRVEDCELDLIRESGLPEAEVLGCASQGMRQHVRRASVHTPASAKPATKPRTPEIARSRQLKPDQRATSRSIRPTNDNFSAAC